MELNVPAAEGDASSEKQFVIPPKRTRYLSEIAEQIRHYNDWTEKQAATAGQLQALQTAQALVDEAAGSIEAKAHALQLEMDPKVLEWLEQWPELRDRYESEVFTYQCVQGHQRSNHEQSLSHLDIPKIAVPRLSGWSDLTRWSLQENLPGSFPYTAGIVRSSARARIRRACLPEKADRSEPTSDSTTYRKECRPTAVHCL